MKYKKSPKIQRFGNHLEQGCLVGLNPKQARFAKEQIDKAVREGQQVFYGMIRQMALDK